MVDIGREMESLQELVIFGVFSLITLIIFIIFGIICSFIDIDVNSLALVVLLFILSVYILAWALTPSDKPKKPKGPYKYPPMVDLSKIDVDEKWNNYLKNVKNKNNPQMVDSSKNVKNKNNPQMVDSSKNRKKIKIKNKDIKAYNSWKNCPYCGKDIPVAETICYYCQQKIRD